MTRYVVISPMRDECDNVERCISSVRSQTILPCEWVLVNDGSTDGTRELIERQIRDIDWIRLVNVEDRGCRLPGVGVVNAFYKGFDALLTKAWDFIIKLDGDLSFEPNYFERCFAKFSAIPRLGIGGGVIRSVVDGKLKLERTNPRFHVRGATKIYRSECWDEIGGLERSSGWDTLDEVKANMLGWTTQSFDDIPIVQHRPTGQAEGAWRDVVKNGRANYFCGYHPLFMLFKMAKRVFRKPYVLGSLALLWGYLGGHLQRGPRVDDPELIRYLRRQQLKRLLLRESIWR